jgi:hypothetical protein
MAQQFGRAAFQQSGGMSYRAWCDKYLTSTYLSGDAVVEAFMCDGTKKALPIRRVGVLYTDFKQLGTSVVGKPLVHNNEVVYFDLDELYTLWFDTTKTHPLFKTTFKNKSAIIPLGTPTTTVTNIPYQQAGRFWRSLGANTLNMSDDNLIIAMFNALSTTTYEMVDCKSEALMKSYFGLIVRLARVVKSFTDSNTTCKAIIDQLRGTRTSQDMLQYSLSFVFGEADMDKKIMLTMLDIVLKRQYKHNSNLFTRNSLTHPIIGIIAVMFVAPLFRKFFSGEIDEDKMFLDYYTVFLEITQKLDSLKESELNEFNKDAEIVMLVSNLIGHPLELQTCRQLIQFCKRNSSSSQPAPFGEWGVFEEIVSQFNINTQGIMVDDKKKVKVLPASVTTVSATESDVSSSSGTDWSGVTVDRNGFYTIRSRTLGVASSAKGNTKGQALVANVRFTFGDYILPSNREGYASSGMHFVGGQYLQKASFPTDIELVLVVEDDKVVLNRSVFGVNEEIISMRRLYPTEKVMIAFKNVELKLKYSEAVAVVPDAPAPSALLT